MSLRHIELAETDEWRIRQIHCSAGPQDRPFEEAHGNVSISLVAAGTFEYRTVSGEAVLFPGAYLLGNTGQSFECGHRHGVGDRCIALHVSQHVFEEIAASAAGSSRFKFNTPLLPPLKQLAPHSALLQSLSSNPSSKPSSSPRLAELNAAVYGLIESAIGLTLPFLPACRRVPASDARRISQVLRHIEGDTAAALDLDSLAAVARMSKFHFLRTFRRVTGATPHQYVLDLRMRQAALGLTRSGAPVVRVALDAGFDDVSTFNRYFKQTFNTTPTRYRRQWGRAHG